MGEWNLESIVKEILPDGSYEFQANLNPENQDRVDCAVKTADGVTIPIDSKFYAGQYKQYQEAGQANIRANVLRDLRNLEKKSKFSIDLLRKIELELGEGLHTFTDLMIYRE